MAGKVIFLDVDGTITNYNNEIPESAKQAIKAAREAGNRVYMCTGRSKAENPPEIIALGFDGMIGGDGSFVEDNGEIIMHQHLNAEQCRHIVDWLHGRNLEFFLESNNGLFASERFREVARPVLQRYAGGKGAKDVENLKTEDLMPALLYGGELYREDVNKVSFILGSYQDYLDAIEEFDDMETGTWGGAGEEALFGALRSKGINKGHAIKLLLEHLGASVGDTYAFGDAKVDIPMFEVCSVGVAMGSGGDECKAAADYITDAVDDDGLYNAFKHFGLME